MVLHYQTIAILIGVISMNLQFGNEYVAKLYKRVPNSVDYETMCIDFKCRPLATHEKGNIQVISGTLTQNRAITIYAQYIPTEIKSSDKVVFMGKEYLVESVGYSLDDFRAFGSKVLSPEKIISDVPKVIRLV